MVDGCSYYFLASASFITAQSNDAKKRMLNMVEKLEKVPPTRVMSILTSMLNS